MGGLGLRPDIRRTEWLPVPITGRQTGLASAHLSHFTRFCVGFHELSQARFISIEKSASIPELFLKHGVLFQAPKPTADPVISSAPTVDCHGTYIFPATIEPPRTLAENPLYVVARQLGEHDFKCPIRVFLVVFRRSDRHGSTAFKILPILVHQHKPLNGLALAETRELLHGRFVIQQVGELGRNKV
jgi:hypothetical protein